MALLSKYVIPDSLRPQDPKRFWKFRNTDNSTGSTTYRFTNAFISSSVNGLDRRIYVAGGNDSYFIGLGNNVNYARGGFMNVPTSAFEPGELPQEIFLGVYVFYILTNLGNLYSMGYNGAGALGINSTTDSITPVKITTFDKNVAKFQVSSGAVGYDFCYAITTSGQLYTWGYNGHYNLGFNDYQDRLVPTLVNTGSVADKIITQIYPKADTLTSYCCGYVIDSDRNVHVVGNNGSGHLGTGNTTAVSNGFVQLPAIKADKIWMDMYNSNGGAYILDGNTLYTAGYNIYGSLGNGTNDGSYLYPFANRSLFQGVSIETIHIGSYYGGCFIAILTDGTVRTLGYNGAGQVGDGGTSNKFNSLYNPTYLNLNSTTRRAIKVRTHGWNNHFILTADGKIYISGNNEQGQQCTGDTTQTNSFVDAKHPTGLKWIDFEPFGTASTIGCTAVDEKNDIWCVGYSGYGLTAQIDTSNNPNLYNWRRAHIN